MIGPFLSEGRRPHSDGARRNVTLHHQVALRNHVIGMCRYTSLSWLQQDVAAPHTASATVQLIQKHFGMQLAQHCALRSARPWPASFPDISPNFLLWGHLIGLSYKRNLQTPTAAKEVSESRSMSRIRRHMQKTMKILRWQADTSFTRNERHVKYVLLRLISGNCIVQMHVE